MEQTTKIKKWHCLNSTHLKIIAMISMFIDHLGKTILYDQEWMSCVGRIAFPIFAFQIAEGYNHTRDFKKYLKRMFIYALISEIPYNVMAGGLINPTGQNVMFTFCIALVVIRLIDNSWKKNKVLGIAVGIAATFVGYILGFLFMTDYMGYGVLTVVVLWILGKIKFSRILQFLAIIYINWEMIAGLNLVWTINGKEVWVPVQAFAILAMIPIAMYNGKKGQGGTRFQHAVYIFYPVHMLILGILMMIFCY